MYGSMGSQAVVNDPVAVACSTTPDFQEWLASADGAIAASTYQAGKVALIGWDGRRATLLMRQFDKPLGLTASANRIVLAARHDLWVFANSPSLAYEYIEDQPGRYDAIYLPRATYHTGDLHTHDVAILEDEIWLAATRFSCLAKLSFDFSFTPAWKPRFVTDLVPEDRCHLNGIAVREGRPKYVTALGITDEAGAWRERKATGGVVIDVDTDEIVLDRLAMPHSPRWHDGRLWLLNSGAGELLVTDPKTGKAETVCGLPGYLRGLCFHGPYALVGLSKIREKHIFGGLPVQEKYERLLCGVAVVDLRSGRQAGFFEFTVGCEELYDVQFLPGIRRPTILNLEKPAARQAIANPESCYWLRPSNELGSPSFKPPLENDRERTLPLGETFDRLQPLKT
ncbi:MAG: TIGR03032 family protein [Pirellulales bacterium]|nr:TIGR03032 family protein [Pirellulales bacterium]